MDCQSYTKYRPNETTGGIFVSWRRKEEVPRTDTGPGKETLPEPEKTSAPPEAGKKTEQQAKNPQVSVYDFAEIMREKKAEERAVASGGKKPAPVKTEKPEKQPEAPKKAERKQEKTPINRAAEASGPSSERG